MWLDAQKSQRLCHVFRSLGFFFSTSPTATLGLLMCRTTLTSLYQKTRKTAGNNHSDGPTQTAGNDPRVPRSLLGNEPSQFGERDHRIRCMRSGSRQRWEKYFYCKIDSTGSVIYLVYYSSSSPLPALVESEHDFQFGASLNVQTCEADEA